MNRSCLLECLSQNQLIFRSMLKHFPEEAVHFRAGPGKWCALEFIGNLLDEEVEDFRTRTLHTVVGMQGKPPPIDPEGWVQSRNYLGASFNEKVEAFLFERGHSIEMLKQQIKQNTTSDWENGYEHMKVVVGNPTGE